MSAFIDAMVGDDYTSAPADAGGFSLSGAYGAPDFTSGAFQAASALGLGYLSRRLDIDLSKRAATTGSTSIASTQRPIGGESADLGSIARSPVGMLVIAGAAIAAVVLLLKA